MTSGANTVIMCLTLPVSRPLISASSSSRPVAESPTITAKQTESGLIIALLLHFEALTFYHNIYSKI